MVSTTCSDLVWPGLYFVSSIPWLVTVGVATVVVLCVDVSEDGDWGGGFLLLFCNPKVGEVEVETVEDLVADPGPLPLLAEGHWYGARQENLQPYQREKHWNLIKAIEPMLALWKSKGLNDPRWS